MEETAKEEKKDFRHVTGVRLILTAAIVVVALWFAWEIIGILFFFFLAIVLTLILNAPTQWLVSKGMNRTVAALIVFFGMLIFIGLVGWLVVPRMLDQLNALISNIPKYYDSLKNDLYNQLSDYPSLQEKIAASKGLEEELPSLANIATSVGRFSFSVINTVFLLIVFFSIVIYMLIQPGPLVATYLYFFPVKQRPRAARALARASTMMVGWMWSNVVVGTIEGVSIFIFLKFMDVPGVWVWAGLALFAEMIPKLGLYIMATPPTLVALSIDPWTGFWVLVFYLLLNEIMGDFVVPRVRASTMNLHPVSTLFVMVALIAPFGLMGALVSTPLTAFIKAYYEEFYLSRTSKENIKEQVKVVLERRVPDEDEIKKKEKEKVEKA